MPGTDLEIQPRIQKALFALWLSDCDSNSLN
jgi:hypothetical protein